MTVPNITLNDGKTIPQLGFGVFQIDPSETKAATLAALEVGYRHIDTAEMYGNEKEVGEAIAESGIPRDEIFVTSKLNNGFHDPAARWRTARSRPTCSAATPTCSSSTGRCPPSRTSSRRGRPSRSSTPPAPPARSACRTSRRTTCAACVAETDVPPAVNQIEVHPYLAQDELRAVDRELGIATEAWSPIAQGLVLDDETIIRIAGAVGKTPAQVVLRWHIQRGDIVFPKSVTRARVEENFAIFDFELSDEDMTDITTLDKGHRTGPDPDTFDYVPA